MHSDLPLLGVVTDQGVLSMDALKNAINMAYDAPGLDSDPHTAMVFTFRGIAYVGTIKHGEPQVPVKGTNITEQQAEKNKLAAVSCFLNRQARRMKPEDLPKLGKLQGLYTVI